MVKLAMENNLSETAFIVKEREGYRLHWFTPGTGVELCGHATLASSFVILNNVVKNWGPSSYEANTALIRNYINPMIVTLGFMPLLKAGLVDSQASTNLECFEIALLGQTVAGIPQPDSKQVAYFMRRDRLCASGRPNSC